MLEIGLGSKFNLRAHFDADVFVSGNVHLQQACLFSTYNVRVMVRVRVRVRVRGRVGGLGLSLR